MNYPVGLRFVVCTYVYKSANKSPSYNRLYDKPIDMSLQNAFDFNKY